jgi:hypothetical protein
MKIFTNNNAAINNTTTKKEEGITMMTMKMVTRLVYRERRFPVVTSNTKAKRSQVVVAANLIDSATESKFVAGKELIEALGNMSAADIKYCLDSFMEAYREATGEYVNMNQFTMYQDYPDFIISADIEEVLFRQYVSYVTQEIDRLFDTKLHKEIFEQEKIERSDDADDEYENVRSIVLRPGTQDDALRILKAMIASKTNLSEEDKELLVEALDMLDDETFYSVLPKKISQKTTLKVVASKMIRRKMDISVLGIKNAVDAIRLAHELSGSDKRFSLRNPERMAILDIINKDVHAIANMYPHREDFIRLGEHIHPKKYAKRFPNAAKAYQELRDKERSERNIMSLYNTAILNGDVLGAANVLKSLPGRFVQEVDALLSLAMIVSIQNQILDILEAVVAKAPAKRVYQAYIHFSNRATIQSGEKYTFDRYSRPKEYTKEVIEISPSICERAAKICFDAFVEMKQQFGDKKYYINSERFSKAIIDRIGSRIAIRDTNWLRLFCYWIGQDVDLSAVFLDENFGYMTQVSWQNLRTSGDDNDELLAYHSEDITNAPYGGAEYIDINRKKLRKLAEEKGYRYVAIINVVYRGPAFHNMPDAFVGVTAIKNPGRGEVFKPHAVEIKSKVKSGRANLAFLYDVVEDEVILVNSDITPENATCCIVSSCLNEIVMACNAVTKSEKFNLDQYIKDIVTVSGGTLVENKEDADVIFDTDGIDIFDDVLYAEYI